jgi:hypothetical protein
VDDFGKLSQIASKYLKVERKSVLLGVARHVILVEEAGALPDPENAPSVTAKPSEPPPASMIRCIEPLPAQAAVPVVDRHDIEDMLSLADIEYLLGGT